MNIEWVEPPHHVLQKVRKSAYTDVAAALRQRPGQWALAPGERTPGSAAGLAQNIRRGKMKDFPPRQFDAVHDGTRVYIRFIGEDVEDAGSSDPGSSDDEQPADDDDGESNTPAEDSAVVRAWGRANGFDLPERGRLPAEVWAAYARRQDSEDD